MCVWGMRSNVSSLNTDYLILFSVSDFIVGLGDLSVLQLLLKLP